MPDNLQSIFPCAFYECSSLEEIVLPDSVTTIGANAFYGCSNLEKVVLPGNLQTIGASSFYDCESLVEVVLPSNLNTIGENAFYNCKKITNVYIPDSIQSIGAGAFNGCIDLSEVTFPHHIYESICEANFKDTTYWNTFPELTDIQPIENLNIDVLKKGTKGSKYFYENIENLLSKLKSTEGRFGVYDNTYYLIEDGYETKASIIKSLSDSEQIVIPTYIKEENQLFPVRKIYYGAFCWKNKIREINLPKTIEDIGEVSFFACENLESIKIPDGVTRIERDTFRNCNKLSEVIIPESVTFIGVRAFDDTTWKDNIIKNQTEDCFYVNNILLYGVNKGSIEIKDGTTLIATNAFLNCDRLKDIKIPSSIDIIYQNAFDGCVNLESIDLNSVRILGYGAFMNCKKLKEVKLSNNLTKLNDYVFENCTSLTSITLPETLGTFNKNVFDGCRNLSRIMISRELLPKVTLPENVEIVVY